MKILLLTPAIFSKDGGIERSMRILLKALCDIYSDQGHVYSFSLADDAAPSTQTLGHYSNHTLKSHRYFSHNKYLFALSSINQALKSNLVICGHLHQLVIARIAKLLNPRLRCCLITHGVEVWKPFSLIERWALRSANKILCVSEFTKRQVLRFERTIKAERLHTIFWVLDPQFAPFPLETQVSKNQRKKPPIILGVGRLSRADNYKGLDTLIEAMPAVSRSFPEARLHIVGAGDDLPRLQSLAAEVGAENSVNFLGRISDKELANEYAHCTLFALPSRKEGFGIVYLEAMSYGKPCICANTGGAPEVLTSPEAGSMVEYGNIPALATAIISLFRSPLDPEQIHKHMAKFSYERFRHRISDILSTGVQHAIPLEVDTLR